MLRRILGALLSAGMLFGSLYLFYAQMDEGLMPSFPVFLGYLVVIVSALLVGVTLFLFGLYLTFRK